MSCELTYPLFHILLLSSSRSFRTYCWAKNLIIQLRSRSRHSPDRTERKWKGRAKEKRAGSRVGSLSSTIYTLHIDYKAARMPKPAKKRAKDDDSDTSDSGPDDRSCNRSWKDFINFTSYLTKFSKSMYGSQSCLRLATEQFYIFSNDVPYFRMYI